MKTKIKWFAIGAVVAGSLDLIAIKKRFGHF